MGLYLAVLLILCFLGEAKQWEQENHHVQSDSHIGLEKSKNKYLNFCSSENEIFNINFYIDEQLKTLDNKYK